jgi:hypothetical protein
VLEDVGQATLPHPAVRCCGQPCHPWHWIPASCRNDGFGGTSDDRRPRQALSGRRPCLSLPAFSAAAPDAALPPPSLESCLPRHSHIRVHRDAGAQCQEWQAVSVHGAAGSGERTWAMLLHTGITRHPRGPTPNAYRAFEDYGRGCATQQTHATPVAPRQILIMRNASCIAQYPVGP